MSANRVRVAIVEDQRDIREGLRFLIDGTPGYACAGAFSAVEPALTAVSPAVADIVLMDLGLPGMSGVQGIALLKARHPELRLIALTVYEDPERIFEALCAGASGYLLKKTRRRDCWNACRMRCRAVPRCRPTWPCASSRSFVNFVRRRRRGTTT
jgi:DNA-binding NarL/FixJ family response regulator